MPQVQIYQGRDNENATYCGGVSVGSDRVYCTICPMAELRSKIKLGKLVLQTFMY